MNAEAKDDEIEGLKAQLLLKEAEATEATLGPLAKLASML
ncbi:hypothetical protein Tco_0602745, partial [Tanacetum coccineum]